MNPPKKHKRVRLSLSDKLGILQRIDSGEDHVSIASFYNVTYKVVYLVKRNREKILHYSQLQGPVGMQSLLSKKMMNKIASSPLEIALFSWFESAKEKGTTITGRSMKDEALRINRELGGSSDFKASDGWLHRFKRRHAIQQIKLQGVGLRSVDVKTARNFCDEFKLTVAKNGYKPENIYNVVKSGLQWNSVPQEIEKVGFLRALKDRVPLILCANSNGSHRLKVLVSGRVQNPRSFKGFDIPVKYVFHGNGFPSDLFLSQWFLEVFAPEIKQRRVESGNEEKILLVMDTAPTPRMTHQAEELGVRIVVIPHEAMPVLQPLHQGILERFKKAYKEDFMEEMVVEKNGIKCARDKKWTIRDCCFSIAYAWDTFTVEDFQVAWRKLLKIDELDDRNNEVPFYSCGVTKEEDEDETSEGDQNMGESEFFCAERFCQGNQSDGVGNSYEIVKEESENTCELSSSVPNLGDSTQCNTESGKSGNDAELRSLVSSWSDHQNSIDQPQISQLDAEQMNLEEEIKQIPMVPSTRDALNAITVMYKWANHQGNTTRQEMWDIAKLRLMVLNKTY